MFLKKLLIESKEGPLREITFHKGINLIIDETPENNDPKKTGNNVGKTTVLRLIDYCLGSKGESIYKDTEFTDQPNTTIQNFLKEKEVKITVELVDTLEDSNNKNVTIERNFLSKKAKILKINGEDIKSEVLFKKELEKIIFGREVVKPSFRQIVSKNIRIEKDRMEKIVKVLGNNSPQEEYEALYLFWFGINTDNAEEKTRLAKEKKQEEKLLKKFKADGFLLTEQDLIFYNNKIEELEERKRSFNLNENYDADIEDLNKAKSQLNEISNEISQAEVRKGLIQESKDGLEKEYSNIDKDEIKYLYEKANALIPNIQVSFEKALKFHNDLVFEKINYITKELPDLEKRIKILKAKLISLIEEEKKLTNKVRKAGFVEGLEEVIAGLSKYYELKGRSEERKKLWEETSEKVKEIEGKIEKINSSISLVSDEIEDKVTNFNRHFTKISEALYGESYILAFEKTGTVYELSVANAEGNPSTGKKKGQIAAFDFSYIQFADEFKIDCLHFIMHDQLENIHSNQLNTLIKEASNINGQYIVPILRDKIPSNVDTSAFEVLSLSQERKLFKVS